MNLLILLVLSYKIVSSTKGLEQARIVGGVEIEDDKYPFVVPLKTYTDQFYCGGTIVDDLHVVTAAHCEVDVRNTIVVIGTNSLNDNGKVFRLTSSVSHPDFNASTYENDVAVLTLSEKISTFFNYSFPERSTERINDVQYCEVLGWGYVTANGTTSNKLKVANVTILPEFICKSLWKNYFTSCSICATSHNNGFCRGDSGGPLICNGKFAGIVSFSKSCATGVPDVYTRITCYNDWIDSEIKNTV